MEKFLSNLTSKTIFTIIDQTFEEIKFNNYFDLITLRYVKLTNQLLNNILNVLNINGFFIYYSPLDLVNVPVRCSTITYSYTTDINKDNKYFSVIQKK